ncbi:serine hydrolase domain-containing protein [Rhodohalobacter barkolensis]|uniref:6-aminohexanoate hydrolase n=1 Tax=Rhodohalobacter barkolensis TaxID=2053187 RepID=A0A2N0VHQ4_9BACT|nr:serine hydrolase [Rhodohalobacter barkolensis]PKD43720.1 6-aminohexanoate hydrolase [Rhodohalobacter barkolensis]
MKTVENKLLIILALLIIPFSVESQDLNSLNRDALNELKEEVIATNSDAFLLMKDDSLLVEWYSDGPQKIELMSGLKSVVALGVGRLLYQQKIDSLDQPVHSYFPEWKQGRKKDITIRHLLNHTSGLQNVSNAGVEIYPSPNALQLALTAELTSDPGAEFSYNNKAVNLLAGIFQKATGKRMDHYFRDEFFRPLHITDYKWYLDKSETPHAMAGLELSARDFAKFGQLVLHKGIWNDNQLVSEDYINEMLEQGQTYYPLSGLLWWRMPEYVHYNLTKERIEDFIKAGIDSSILNKLEPLQESSINGIDSYRQTMQKVFGSDWREIRDKNFRQNGFENIFKKEYGPIAGYYAEGYLGQYLVVIPGANLVAVRQIQRKESYNSETDNFQHFRYRVLNLVFDNASQ